ncbi:MAG: bifunctional diguanylate cyclase/phosphodiesterase [Lachnospiraceae bacterium]|nr:bifunctional diguanylate cyclase/phosphodiesterase [Lachnospiraceae bacterium]
MKKEDNNNKKNIEKNLNKISPRRESSKISFAVILLFYLASVILLSKSANGSADVFIKIFDSRIPITAFTGVFSSISNICIILLVVLFGKIGFVVSLLILSIQVPTLLLNVFVNHQYASLPGIFSTIFTIIAILLLHANNKKIEKYQKKLRDEALKDALTGLPSRLSIVELVHELIKLDEKFAVVLVDLNNFKSINDTMGHNFGNKLLVEVARRWGNIASSGTTGTVDFVSRQGGDEFAFVIRNYENDDEILRTITAYKEELEKTIIIDDRDFYMTASFGYTLFPEDTRDNHSLFSYADAAMYAVKRLGNGNHIRKFSHDLIEEAEHVNMIERKIRNALDNDMIFFNLQPQYDISHKLRGFEALARMKDEDGKTVSPGEFIPVAEKVGLIDKVDSRIMEKSAQFFGKMLKKYKKDITLSVNVSAVHLLKKDFIDEVKNTLKENSIPAEKLEIEITESIMINFDENAIECINELKALGVKIAIDDFGTGYSSLSYLHTIPADLLKIDKSFIDKMSTGESSKKYVATIINIGHLLKFEVISEGVEDEEQLDTLRKIGCDYIQGFVWGKPLGPQDAEEVIKL